MNFIKIAIKYIGVFSGILVILFSGLMLTSYIPRECIEENLQESAEFYKYKQGIHRLHPDRQDLRLHYYADSMLLNIIYCIDTEHPIQSTLWSNYYETEYVDKNDDFIEVVETQKEPTNQYLRYWHGSMMIIRPLLLILNIEQIYMVNRSNISWFGNSFTNIII